jgi:hypothetical protein
MPLHVADYPKEERRGPGPTVDVRCSRRFCFVLFLHVLDDRQAGGRWSCRRFLLRRRLRATGHWCASAYPWYTSSNTAVKVSAEVPWSVTATACSGSLCVAHCVKAALVSEAESLHSLVGGEYSSGPRRWAADGQLMDCAKNCQG